HRAHPRPPLFPYTPLFRSAVLDLAEVITEAVAEANQVAQSRFAEYHGAKPAVILTVPRNALRKVLGLLLRRAGATIPGPSVEHRSEEHTSELQSQSNLVCR